MKTTRIKLTPDQKITLFTEAQRLQNDGEARSRPAFWQAAQQALPAALHFPLHASTIARTDRHFQYWLRTGEIVGKLRKKKYQKASAEKPKTRKKYTYHHPAIPVSEKPVPPQFRCPKFCSNCGEPIVLLGTTVIDFTA